MRRALPLAAALAVAACGGATHPTTKAPRSTAASSGAIAQTSTGRATTTSAPSPPALKPAPPPPSYPPYPQLLHGASITSLTHGFIPAARWHGKTAAWVAHTPGGVSLLRFDQRLLRLTLHSGTLDAGADGWRNGPVIAGLERLRLLAAFNGGFRLDTGAGGFASYGRVAVPLRAGLGSIVTYADGPTDIGAWHEGVPAPGQPVASVRQNLDLLVDHGLAADNAGCSRCWGATLGGVSDPARSALGITADGHLIWVGGEHLTPSDLAAALVAAGVQRAVELDINPEWVAAYLYDHHPGSAPVTAVPVMPDQSGIPGQLLAPYSRDFFTVAGR